MSASENQSRDKGQSGVLVLLLVIFLVWVFSAGRPHFSNTGRDLKTTIHDAGQDLKSSGRDAADSIRHGLQ
jgi:hypothetical protein